MTNKRLRRETENGLDRRTFIKGAAAVGALAGVGLPIQQASAGEVGPVITLGDFKVMSLSDGYLTLPASFRAPNVSEKERSAALAKAGQTTETIASPLNVTLITTKTDRILIDTGSGSRFMDTAGQLAAALETAGVAPEDITKVIYTHAHPDHCWGTLDDFDELTFSNAEHVISEAEFNYWMSPKTIAEMPDDRKAFAAGAKRQLSAAKDVLKTVKPGADVVTGVRVVDTSGHTPGHISLEIGTGNERLMVLGDALTHPVISFEHPEWASGGDQDGERAGKIRKSLLPKLAAEGHRIVGYHLPQPGYGRVVKSGAGFAFETIKA